MKKLISIVIPAYNESASLTKTCLDISNAIPKEYDYKILVVNDGSTDTTIDKIQELSRKNPNVLMLSLSRNFGKELATTAGLNNAAGDATIIIDADGQHPPELIPEFISKWEKGNKVVVGIRESNSNEGVIKKYGSKLFYILLDKFAGVQMIPSSTDFRIIDKEVRDEFNKMKESNRITRGLIDWLGYEVGYINFKAKAREKGSATYSTKKLIKLALDSIVSLSLAPLYLSGYFGLIITGLSFISGIVILLENYILNDPLNWNISGSASLGILILFLVGILLISQGLLALYVSRIYEETRDRPLYVLDKTNSIF